MKFIDEYRDPEAVRKTVSTILRITTQPHAIMEVCGGQTHAIMKFGLDKLLPPEIRLIHGPGCPVCVTPVELIDKALEIASCQEVIFCSFGDMMRVPGSEKDLLSVKAEGGDVRMVYSPMDALKIAVDNPGKRVVFFAVGFETTAPANAMAVHQAKLKGVTNFSILSAGVLIPPAVEAILSSPESAIQGLLAPGHVCVVSGYSRYEEIARRFKIPIVVTGFEPLDILNGILACVKQLEEGKAEVENQYARVVTRKGNIPAQKLMQQVFRVVDCKWRGIGVIPQSGLKLTEEYASFDAENMFGEAETKHDENSVCISGLVLQGVNKPAECPAFASLCTPEHPLGATMVSSEGACAAYYRYGGKLKT